MLAVRSAALRSIIGWALCCVTLAILAPPATSQCRECSSDRRAFGGDVSNTVGGQDQEQLKLPAEKVTELDPSLSVKEARRKAWEKSYENNGTISVLVFTTDGQYRADVETAMALHERQGVPNVHLFVSPQGLQQINICSNGEPRVYMNGDPGGIGVLKAVHENVWEVHQKDYRPQHVVPADHD